MGGQGYPMGVRGAPWGVTEVHSFFSGEMKNPITNLLRKKKWVSLMKKWAFDAKNAKIRFLGSNAHFFTYHVHFFSEEMTNTQCACLYVRVSSCSCSLFFMLPQILLLLLLLLPLSLPLCRFHSLLLPRLIYFLCSSCSCSLFSPEGITTELGCPIKDLNTENAMFSTINDSCS